MSISDLIKLVEGRPRMFLPEESTRYMSALLTGFFLAQNGSKVNEFNESKDSIIYGDFQEWVQKKYDIKTTHGVESITTFWSGGDKESLKLFFQL